MAGFTFKGGVHPYEGKELSKDKPIKRFIPEGDLVFPLSQHIGAPAKPVVSKGDTVLAGQLIAEAEGFVSANIYSSVSGTVKSIDKHRVATGDMVNSITITSDGNFTAAPRLDIGDIADMSRQEVIDGIRLAGIVGMGGAGFPTHVKLSPKDPDKIYYCIVNCSECEPYLTSDYRRMMEEPEKLVAGLKIILCLFEHAEGILAVEDNKPDCIRKLKELVIDEKRITVKPLKTKYPQGAERQLIYATTKRAINSSMLPADAGCVVNNVDTVVSIYHAIIEKRPLTERIVTVTGDAVVEPQNYLVPIGTSYKQLIEASGGFKSTPEKIISGGPMMGFAMFDLDVPIIKTSSAITCFLKDDVAGCKPTNCINCGRCAEVCPGRVIPARLADYAEAGDEERFLEYNGMECCECGCCSYICPAKRQLTQSIKTMRKLLLAKKKKK
ncbi:MAG: electron transport complex subunit RsxC [Lachnospiraceae bacterium]|nr:electron transport complex subunit RsxC [Lachnospiraceae bacterium]